MGSKNGFCFVNLNYNANVCRLYLAAAGLTDTRDLNVCLPTTTTLHAGARCRGAARVRHVSTVSSRAAAATSNGSDLRPGQHSTSVLRSTYEKICGSRRAAVQPFVRSQVPSGGLHSGRIFDAAEQDGNPSRVMHPTCRGLAGNGRRTTRAARYRSDEVGVWWFNYKT